VKNCVQIGQFYSRFGGSIGIDRFKTNFFTCVKFVVYDSGTKSTCQEKSTMQKNGRLSHALFHIKTQKGQ